MSIFCIKKLEAPESVGSRLKHKREQLGEQPNAVAIRINVAEKYLIALENDDYKELPNTKAHRRAYLKKYALAIGLSPSTLWRQFVHENGLGDVQSGHPAQALKNIRFDSLASLIRNISIAAIVIIFAGYLIWQIRGILTPPRLIVYTPMDGAIANHLNTTVQGVTDKECQLSVNGKNIMIDEQGKFSTEIGLAPGVNVIKISAIKKHGKTTTIIRSVIVKDKK